MFAAMVLALAADAVRVDQVGYPTDAPKVAVVSAAEDIAARKFVVRRVSDDEVVFTGALSKPLREPQSGERLQTADFSSLREPGRYAVHVEGGRSHPFEVRNDVYESVLHRALDGFRGQRCGTAVDLGDGYAHPECHTAAAFHGTSGRTDGEAPRGGWHDAGDYGRYVVNSGITMGTLLWAYELFPDAFRRMDLLGEVRWNLRWMLAMQDGDGGVWHKQTSERFPPFVQPQDDASLKYVIGTGKAPYKSSCATADFAAVTAIAGRVFARDDPEFADISLAASRRAWAWLLKHPSTAFRNPRGVETGEYGDTDCRDEMLWAAAERWRSAGDGYAQIWFLRNRSKAIDAISSARPPDWKHVGALAAWTYAMHRGGDPAAIGEIRRKSAAAADEIVARAAGHGYRIPLTKENYEWGSNGNAANYALQLLVANAMRPNRIYVDGALDVVHYLLGRNPFSVSWVTGVGSAPFMKPHHRPSGSDDLAAPWPGLLSGGPNRNRQDAVLRAMPRGTPPMKMWADAEESYAGNEIAINWNAPLVFVLAGVFTTETQRSAEDPQREASVAPLRLLRGSAVNVP